MKRPVDPDKLRVPEAAFATLFITPVLVSNSEAFDHTAFPLESSAVSTFHLDDVPAQANLIVPLVWSCADGVFVPIPSLQLVLSQKRLLFEVSPPLAVPNASCHVVNPVKLFPVS